MLGRPLGEGREDSGSLDDNAGVEHKEMIEELVEAIRVRSVTMKRGDIKLGVRSQNYDPFVKEAMRTIDE